MFQPQRQPQGRSSKFPVETTEIADCDKQVFLDGVRQGLAEDAAYLVRPDVHVGFARGGLDAEALKAYLGRFGITGS